MNGSIIITYSDKDSKGFAASISSNIYSVYVASMGILFSVASVVVKNDDNKRNLERLFPFMFIWGLTALSPILSIFLVTKLPISDSNVVTKNIKEQGNGSYKAILEDGRYLPLYFIFIILYFPQSYLFNVLNFNLINTKLRGINIFLYWMGRLPVSYFLSLILDNKKYDQNKRALNSVKFAYVMICLPQLLLLLYYIIQLIVKSKNFEYSLLFIYFFYGCNDSYAGIMTMFMIYQLTQHNANLVPYSIAVCRSFSAVGCALSWSVSLLTKSNFPSIVIIGFSSWLFALHWLRKMLMMERQLLVSKL